MKTNRVQRLILGLSPVAAVLWGLMSSACSQPELFCATATGNFNLRMQLVGGTECIGPTSTFAVQTFFAAGEGRPQFEKGSVTITDMAVADHFLKLEESGQPMGGDPFTVEQSLHAVGNFGSADPTSDDLCSIPALNATVALPAITDDPMTEMDDESRPATARTYAWTNVQIEISPSVQGTVLWGDLAYQADGCTAQYAVKGVWPALGCPSMDVNECFCINVDADHEHVSVPPSSDACDPSGLGQDFVGQIECLAGACVFTNVTRP